VNTHTIPVGELESIRERAAREVERLHKVSAYIARRIEQHQRYYKLSDSVLEFVEQERS